VREKWERKDEMTPLYLLATPSPDHEGTIRIPRDRNRISDIITPSSLLLLLLLLLGNLLGGSLLRMGLACIRC
jgi:hypothetical protein